MSKDVTMWQHCEALERPGVETDPSGMVGCRLMLNRAVQLAEQAEALSVTTICSEVAAES